MVRSTEVSRREAKVAEFKRLITSRHFDSLEMLEEAVEAFLWGEEASGEGPTTAGHGRSLTRDLSASPEGCGPAGAAASPC